jgi:hypothetical protein
MAAGAGSLGLLLGGAAVYHGRLEPRPVLGEGRPAGGQDIARALTLVRRSLLLWLAVPLAGDCCVLEHGGRLRAAARRYAASGAGDPAAWLDLSTGINPARIP